MRTKHECVFWDETFIRTIKSVAPGTPLREGLEHILRAKMGALVLIGDGPKVMEVTDGGFYLNYDFTPAAFYELAKMDGALLLSGDAKRIVCANAQLIPSAAIATSETGTRHRTAERTAKQTGAAVIAISQRRNLITLYLGDLRYILKDITEILRHTNQALQTMEKYQKILASGMMKLNALEFQDSTPLGEVAAYIIRAEQLRRIAVDIEHDSIELGEEGRLVAMQVKELIPECDYAEFLIKDYCVATAASSPERMRQQLRLMTDHELEVTRVIRLLGYTDAEADSLVVPRGFRMLKSIPRMPGSVIDNLVRCFKTLPGIYNATMEELDRVEGIGAVRAKMIKDSLRQVRERAFLERYM